MRVGNVIIMGQGPGN